MTLNNFIIITVEISISAFLAYVAVLVCIKMLFNEPDGILDILQRISQIVSLIDFEDLTVNKTLDSFFARGDNVVDKDEEECRHSFWDCFLREKSKLFAQESSWVGLHKFVYVYTCGAADLETASFTFQRIEEDGYRLLP